MDSELAIGNVLIRQRELASGAQLARSYDIIAAGLSWEDRATFCLSQLAYSSTEAMLLKFRSRSTQVEEAKIRQLATFKGINLLEPLAFPNKFDIIFCRNVAIYFSDADKKRLYDGLSRVLAPDGCLIIGSTESLTGICQSFEPKRYLRSIFYQLGPGNG